MERDSYNENFERFLRDHADNLRMPASEKVWKNISKKMDRRRRWIGFSLSAILLLTALGGYYLVNNSVKPLPHPVATAEKQRQSSGGAERDITTSATSVENESLKTPLLTPYNHNVPVPVNSVHLRSTRKQRESIVILNPSTVDHPEVNTTASAIVVPADDFRSSIVDSYGNVSEQKDASQLSNTIKNTTEPLPLSIESVANAYTAKVKKFSLQFSFAPMISYRKLSENKSNMQASATLPSYTVNDAVTQKPDMGFELGVSGKYTISRNVKLIGGLQFNVSKYDIKTFTASYPTIATFRLSSNSGMDSVRTYTTVSNTGGYESNWVQNLYLQFSAPVGVEVKLAGDNNTQFGIATTLQPTYVISNRAYLITSDYQSYAQVPDLTRHWNMNANLQTFVSYSTGKMRWQVGPQVRYQLLSSFVSKYPVKENLFDFGLRVGISLNK